MVKWNRQKWGYGKMGMEIWQEGNSEMGNSMAKWERGEM
jgi:hypothetical protein